MTTETAIGAQGNSKPIKTFNEKLETGLWTLIMKNCNKEKRVDGELAYVVKDVGELVTNIIEFYELQNKR